MNKTAKIVLSAGVLIVVFGTLLFYAKPDGQNPVGVSGKQEQNILSADTLAYDFGTISMKNGIVKTVFKIRNTEASEIALNKIYTSCMCTEATLNIAGASEGPFGMLGHGFSRTFERTLQPGEEAELEVAFDPNAHGPSGVGRIERIVTIEGEGRELLIVAIAATVTP